VSKSPRLVSLLQALLVTFLWSSSYILIKIGLRGISPLAFAATRYSLAFVVLFAMNMVRQGHKAGLRLDAREWLRLIVAGVAGYSIAQGLQFIGLYCLPAVTTTFLLNFTPLFVVMLGVLFLGEVPTKVQALGHNCCSLGSLRLLPDPRINWRNHRCACRSCLGAGLGDIHGDCSRFSKGRQDRYAKTDSHDDGMRYSCSSYLHTPLRRTAKCELVRMDHHSLAKPCQHSLSLLRLESHIKSPQGIRAIHVAKHHVDPDSPLSVRVPRRAGDDHEGVRRNPRSDGNIPRADPHKQKKSGSKFLWLQTSQPTFQLPSIGGLKPSDS